MPVNAVFLADLTSFTAAVDRGTTQLRSFETGASKVERALARMGDAYSGRKTIQDAQLAVKAVTDLGGVSRLTSTEQTRLNGIVTEAIAKYRALGQQAPANMLALADATTKAERSTSLLSSTFGQFTAGFTVANLIDRGVRSLVSFGKEALDTAGKLTDLSGKTGLSIETLQRMDHVAQQTGGTLDQFAEASFKLGVRLSGGSNSVKQALADIGLSFEQISRMRPDQQFEAVAESLSKVSDATQRNEAGMALFGKSFSTIAASIAQGYDSIADSASISSKEQIEALDRAGDAIAKFERDAHTMFTRVVGGFLDAVQASKDANRWWESLSAAQRQALIEQTNGAKNLVEVYREWQRIAEQMDARDKARSGFQASAVAVKSYVDQLKEAVTAARGLDQAQRAQLNAALELGAKSVADLEEEFFGVVGALAIYKTDQQDAEEATRKHAQAMAEAARDIEKYVDGLTKTYDALRKIEGAGRATSVPSGIPGGGPLDLPLPSSVPVDPRTGMTAAPAWFPQMKTQIEEIRDLWREAVEDMKGATAQAFGDMVTGLRGFKEGLLDIWRSIQQGISRIVSDMVYRWLSGLTSMGQGTASFANQVAGVAIGGGGGVSNVTGGGGGGGLGGLFGGASRATTSFGQYGVPAIAGAVAGLSVGYQSRSKAAGALSGAVTGGLTGLQFGGLYGAAVGIGVGAVAGLFGAKLGKGNEREQVSAAREQWLQQFQPNAAWNIQSAIGLFGSNPNQSNLRLWRDFYAADTFKELETYTSRLAAAINSGTARMSQADLPSGPMQGTRNGIPFYANEAFGLRRPHLAVVGDASEPENVVKDSTLRRLSGADEIAGLRAELQRIYRDLPRQISLGMKSALALSGRAA